uniref:lysine-specific demethylase phf2-like n=1 Tax=Oncorhynchus gorbuscha TaxID=8017 RepID=UPI001EAF4407
METEVHKFERTPLSGNKDKFAFSMTHKKLLGSKLKPQTNSSVFSSLQNLKEDKAKPVRDEYEYVSDEGELKIDEFPIRRKKRDLSFLSNIKEAIQPSKKPKLIPSDVKVCKLLSQ